MQRFWDKVDTRGECWVWTGSRTSKGYGKFGVSGGKWELAHRVAWRIYHSDPGLLYVLHRCDNPPCVRKEHLFLGDAKANAEDRERKGRGNQPAGVRHPRAKLTESQVNAIRADSISTHTSLARQYGVSPAAIRFVRTGRNWREVYHRDSAVRPDEPAREDSPVA